jgi:hypothetical protein
VSYSGAGIYDDDTGADVRGRFRELIADRLVADVATDTLMAELRDVLGYHEVACAFWLALADTESRLGRLEDRVRDRALALIGSGEDLARFDHDRSLSNARRRVLDALAARLTSPQPQPVHVQAPFRSLSPVGMGDVFWFRLPSGHRILLRCVAVNGDARDSHPTVEVLDWPDRALPADPTALVARPAQPRAEGTWPDLLTLVRSRRDPDPGARIELVAPATPVKRRQTLPALMVPWTRLEEYLARVFGEGVVPPG